MKIKTAILTGFLLLITMTLSATVLQLGSPELNEALALSKGEDKLFPVNIILREQYDVERLYDRVRNSDKQTRRQQTIHTLKQFSEESQKELREFLAGYSPKDIERLRHLWISNVISLHASKELLFALDSRKDIETITYDPSVYALFNDIKVQNEIEGRNDGTREITYNVEIMNAPDVWELGYTGQDVVVAVIDTGVNYNHNDIRNRMWESEEYPLHGYNFVSNTNNPMDDHNHGTHCAGTVAGDGSSGSQTGVAPGSLIMALKTLDHAGRGEQSDSWAAVEFAVENGADIVSMSLGWTSSGSGNRETWRDIMVNALSAGVVASVAAGNEGSGPSTLRTPGDCPPPWLHYDQVARGGVAAVITSGATNASDTIANFSSRGPAFWTDYPTTQGGLIKPDIVAPGVDVKSLSHSGNTGYRVMSGTSMATPGTAGVIALMLSRSSSMSPEDICQVLQETAYSTSETKDNIYGAGRVDAYSAITMSGFYPDDQAIQIPLKLTLRWFNLSADYYHLNVGTDNPPTNILHNHYLTEGFYEFPEDLERETTHYWQLIRYFEEGDPIEGEIWSFTTIPPPHESFASGDFSKYNWQFSANGGEDNFWYVTGDESYTGQYSAQSGGVDHNQTTSISVRLEILQDGEISFYRKVSSEANYDILRFSIDNQMVGQWSGHQEWRRVSYPVTAGFRTFRWSYIKDPMISEGADAAWLDEITFPPHPPQPVMFIPHNVEAEIDFEEIRLSWDIEYNDEAINPIVFSLSGFNVYRRIADEEEYIKLNDDYLEELIYTNNYDEEGDYHYQLRAVYRDLGQFVESEASDDIVVTIYPGPEAPTITPESDKYPNIVEVQIGNDLLDSYIYYTLDGSEPGLNSLLYEDSFEIIEDTIVKARTYKIGYLPGEIAEASFEVFSSTEEIVEVPRNNSLSVYPNPVRKSSNSLRSDSHILIDYYLREDYETAELRIFNIRGQLTRQIDLEKRQGHYKAEWDVRNSRGKTVGSGVYLLQMKVDNEILTNRVMVIQ